jgi:hypothetical protein
LPPLQETLEACLYCHENTVREMTTILGVIVLAPVILGWILLPFAPEPERVTVATVDGFIPCDRKLMEAK